MSERIAYIEAFSGASGDMLLGAMIDAGLKLDELEEAISKLGLADVELVAKPVVSHGISGTHLDVIDNGHDRPAHNLPAIRKIIGEADLDADVKHDALHVFELIGVAEASVHGVSIEQVHFHEVGAVDSLVDIVGFCWARLHLGIKKVYCSALPLGNGTIRTEHGLLPVPAPATLAILTAARVPTVRSDGQSEMVTPTGAALVAYHAEFVRPSMRGESVGYGFGTREMPWANMLRITIGEALDETWWAAGQGADAHVHEHEEHNHTHDHDHGHTHSHTHESESA